MRVACVTCTISGQICSNMTQHVHRTSELMSQNPGSITTHFHKDFRISISESIPYGMD